MTGYDRIRDRSLTGLLNQPHAALGPRGLRQPVWQCVARAAPGDRQLSDREWSELARDIMHRTGLAPHGQDDDAVRWIAVRHGHPTAPSFRRGPAPSRPRGTTR